MDDGTSLSPKYGDKNKIILALMSFTLIPWILLHYLSIFIEKNIRIKKC